MKFGTIANGTRDGSLIMVNRSNDQYIMLSEVQLKDEALSKDFQSIQKYLHSFQQMMDHYNKVEKILQQVYQVFNAQSTQCTPVHAFDQTKTLSPLPRAYEWIDGSAFINHIILVRKARNAEPPATVKTDPLVYQGGSGTFLAPTEPIAHFDEAFGIDFESEVCVMVDDCPMGLKAEEADKHIKLFMLCNDVSLRNLIPDELAKQFGFFNSKPSTAFSPLAVTREELDNSWIEGRIHLPLVTHLNGQQFGNPNAKEMWFSFPQLLEHICKTRGLTAGTIIGSGTVSNEDESRGSSCLAEKRTIEKIKTGTITTPFLRFGDKVEIEMFDSKGHSIFGRISQQVVKQQPTEVLQQQIDKQFN